MKKIKIVSALLISLSYLSCENRNTATNSEEKVEENLKTVETVTLLGDTLYTPPLKQGEMFRLFDSVEAYFNNHPKEIEAIVWYGRRSAYLGRYQEAIKIYTEGMRHHPENPRLYRHRGHRYISTRQYDKAIADFKKAVSLIEGQEDKIEVDGLPNERNIPLTTLHSNIWYHLGLSYYLKNDLEKALETFKIRTTTDRYDDNTVSSGQWLYMILRRLGREEEAKAVLKDVTKEMDIMENFGYYEICMFYNGLLTVDDLKIEEDNTYRYEILLYGMANWFLYQEQDTVRARSYLKEMLDNGSPYCFAYIAGEADWARLFGKER